MPTYFRALPGVFAVTLVAAAPVQHPDPLHQRIVQEGARAVATSLTAAEWKTELDRAVLGDRRSLDDIASLRAATDASRSEAIDAAMSDALRTDPSEVLRLVATRPDMPTIEWLCQDRAIEPTRTKSRRFVRDATAAVERIDEPRLAALKDACLASLRRAS